MVEKYGCTNKSVREQGRDGNEFYLTLGNKTFRVCTGAGLKECVVCGYEIENHRECVEAILRE